ncbi:MAG: DUF6580 family putative transport protein [Verrucomicrobiota bacterium]|nr:DUF6580 family putative transport protein [Verrucomicrobiota bacterium]
MDRKYLYITILLICFVSARLLPAFSESAVAEAMANISPLAALALCGGMLLPLRVASVLTFGTFLISDIVLNLKYGFPLLNGYSIFLLFVFASLYVLGFALRKKNQNRFIVLLVTTLFSSIVFYILANTVSFIYDPGYVKNIKGWLTANSTGLPGYPPAWLFGIKTIFSNVLFTAAFYFALMPKGETIKLTTYQSQKI